MLTLHLFNSEGRATAREKAIFQWEGKRKRAERSVDLAEHKKKAEVRFILWACWCGPSETIYIAGAKVRSKHTFAALRSAQCI